MFVSDLAPIVALMADDPGQLRTRPVRRRLLQLVAAVEKVSARYALCGAIAMGAHGVRRFTEDINVFVDRRDIERVLAALRRSFRELGREPAEGVPAQVRLRSRRARGPQHVDIDLLVPVDAIEDWALRNAVTADAFGREVRLISTEALVLLKLNAFVDDRDSPEVGRHRVDVARLLREASVDVDGLRVFLRSHRELLDELERILASPAPKGRRTRRDK
jgi:hypothetical protein